MFYSRTSILAEWLWGTPSLLSNGY